MSISGKERAYEVIRSRLAAGDFAPGTRMSDYVIAKELGISRSPVREAISQLASEGLLSQIPHYGTFVRRLTVQELREVYQMREALESFAVWLCAQNPAPELIQELSGYCDEMYELLLQQRHGRQAEGLRAFQEAWVRSDLNFHMAILRATGNQQLLRSVSDMRLLTHACGGRAYSKGFSFSNGALTWKVHKRILRYIERRDAEAARYWMQRHMQKALEGRLEQYDDNASAEADAFARRRDRLIHEIEQYRR